MNGENGPAKLNGENGPWEIKEDLLMMGGRAQAAGCLSGKELGQAHMHPI